MSNESVSVTDQEGKSMAQHLASAERELSTFVTAVHQLFGPEQARYAGDNWMEELEQTDWLLIGFRRDLLISFGKRQFRQVLIKLVFPSAVSRSVDFSCQLSIGDLERKLRNIVKRG